MSTARPGLLRLVIRRTRLVGPQATIWPDWRYHAFATDTDLPAAEADRAAVTPKSSSLSVTSKNPATCPPGISTPTLSGSPAPCLPTTWSDGPNNSAESNPPGSSPSGHHQARLYRIPGHVVNHGGRLRLRLPARWPWARVYQNALANLRGLPQLC